MDGEKRIKNSEDLTNTDDKLEKKLLKFIDVPYFKNHPSYISLWKEYYKKMNDPNILSFMFYKKISCLYHWIYIEFCDLFISNKMYEMANFVIRLGLDNNVYSHEILKKKLLTIPKFETTLSDEKLLKTLKRKNISCFNQKWNISDEVDIVNIESTPRSTFSTSDNNHMLSTLNTEETSNKTITDTAIGNKIKIDKFYYLIKRIEKNGNLITIKLSEDPNVNCDSLLSEDYCFSQIDSRFTDAILNIFPLYEFSKLNDKTYVIFPYDKYQSITPIIATDEFKNSLYKYYYLEKIMKINIAFQEKGYLLINLESYYINELLEVKVNNFNLVKNTELNILNFINILNNYYAETDFSIQFSEMIILIEDKVNEESVQSEIIRHKTSILSLG